MFPPTLTDLPVAADEWQERLLAVHGAITSDELIEAVFRLLEGTVRCDFSLVVLHAVDHLPMVARDSQGRVFSYQFMEQSYAHNPATAFLMANPGVRMLTTREQLPQGDAIFDHPFYEHGMKPMGFRHCLALFFWDYLPSIAHQVFAVFRTEGQEDFNAAEEAAMLSLHPHIHVALKRVRQQQAPNERMLDTLAPVALTLDWDLQIIHSTPAAATALRAWNGEATLPDAFFAACQQLKESWRAMLSLDPMGRLAKRQRVPHPQDENTYAEIQMIFPEDAVLRQPSFLVEFVTTPTSRSETLERLGALTFAEREAVLLAAECLDNQQISDRLVISLPAVKTRLHTAFKKLQITHRSQLVKLMREE